MPDRETEILQALAGRLPASEEQALVGELNYIRTRRTAELAEERSLDFATEVVAAHLTPVQAYERHTSQTEWMVDAVPEGVVDPTGMTQAMRTEASLWWGGLHEAVKADPEEVAIQAIGQARRYAGQYGEAYDVAVKAYVDHIAHLRGREAAEVMAATDQGEGDQNGLARSDLPDGVQNDDVAFPIEDGSTTQPAKVELQGDPPSLAGGSAPEGDSAPQLVNPESGKTHDSHTNSGGPNTLTNPDNTPSDADVQWKSSNLRTARALHEIADDISREWRSQGGVHYTAAPYLDAMRYVQGINDRFGEDNGKTIVAYFLSNASQFKGERAKALKAELKDHLSGKATASLAYQEAPETIEVEGVRYVKVAGDKPPWFDKSQKSDEKKDGDKPGSGDTDDPMGKGAHPAKDSGSGEDDSGGKDEKADHSTNSDKGDSDSSDKDSSSDSDDSSSKKSDSFNCTCSGGKCTCKSASLLGSPVTAAFRERVQANLTRI